jgi:hypothetical protein
MADHENRLTWRDDAMDWCRGRDWRWRAPLMAYLAWTAARGLTDPMHWSWWSGITLGVHEAGHIIFSPFGEFLEVAGGSITQIAAPLVVMWMFRRQRDWYGACVGAVWLSSSLANLATYIGDARAQELPLVGFTDQPEHDWHYLLYHTGLLKQDTLLAGLTRLASGLILASAVIGTIWLCNQMRRSQLQSS